MTPLQTMHWLKQMGRTAQIRRNAAWARFTQQPSLAVKQEYVRACGIEQGLGVARRTLATYRHDAPRGLAALRAMMHDKNRDKGERAGIRMAVNALGPATVS